MWELEKDMDERIIDTCCLLNLFASGDPKEILKHYGTVYVSEQVQGEALWIREYDHESPPQLIPKQIDLAECIEEGVIVVCGLEEQQEIDWFVHFAQLLRSDADASVLAIAKVRGWIVATDDRKACRIAEENQISTISTSEMIHAWTTSQGMSNDQIGQLLRNIQEFGRFRPRRSDTLHDWWMRMVGTSGT